jgi:predicted short-subunit dehydrogenase-like oxidoreductase (DUF2520 family)
LDALAAVPARVGALHPLQTLPTTDAGGKSLAGAWCAVAGDPQVAALAASLDLRPVELADEDRARYHAAACIASNHLVALLDQVEAVAPIPLEAYLPLVRAAIRWTTLSLKSSGSFSPRARRPRRRAPKSSHGLKPMPIYHILMKMN